MKIIEQLSDMISEEIDDAMKYARCAKMHEDDTELARTFKLLAGEELNHMNMIHAQVTRIIREYRETKGEPPADMMAVYNYLHGKQIGKAAEVRAMLS